jgi:hypothetical protein
MHGTLNGLRLKRITSVATQKNKRFVRHTFRVLDGQLPELENLLHLKTSALLILSDREIEGQIAHFSADVSAGYEITLESKHSPQ